MSENEIPVIPPPNELMTEYIEIAMREAVYETLEDDGSHYGEIPCLPGVYANADSLEDCRMVLREVLEGWIILGLELGHPIPVLQSIDLTPKEKIT